MKKTLFAVLLSAAAFEDSAIAANAAADSASGKAAGSGKGTSAQDSGANK